MNPASRPAPRHPAPPFIGIIMLDTVFPRLVGDVGNPRTFPFPVRYETAKGASPQRVVKGGDPKLLQPFLDAARKLENLGAGALATSCGFLAIFQKELAGALNIPVFGSSLLQIHQARAILQKDREVGIITADSQSLTPEHFSGMDLWPPRAVVGLEKADEFSAVFLGNRAGLNREKLKREMSWAGDDLIQRYPRVGAVVLECTNMPPFARMVQQRTGLPVFDAVTMIHYAYSVIRNNNI